MPDETQPKPDPAGGRDRKLDYGNAPGSEVDGDVQRAPDDVEDKLREATVRTEQNPGRDR